MPRKTDASNPADWIYFCESDLPGLKVLADREMCWHMCQSKLSEVLAKALKAELIRLGWTLVKTHDLIRLAQELEKFNSDLMETIAPWCNEMVDWYFADRYPGFDTEEADWEMLRKRIDSITQLVGTIKGRI